MKLLDSSNSIHSFIYSAAVISVIGVFGLLVDVNSGATLKQIDDNEAKWRAKEIKDYQYTFSHGCMFTEKVQVVVRDGLLLRGSYKNSLAFLYIQSRKALLTAYKKDVSFHPLGFPMHLSVDWQESTMDDECYYLVDDFEVIVNS